jgi:hypothetical protein
MNGKDKKKLKTKSTNHMTEIVPPSAEEKSQESSSSPHTEPSFVQNAEKTLLGLSSHNL